MSKRELKDSAEEKAINTVMEQTLVRDANKVIVPQYFDTLQGKFVPVTNNWGGSNNNDEHGEKGSKGEKGEQGPQGIQGEQGLPGAKGEQGEKGLPGEKGTTGERGPQGIQGERGPQGIQGKTGEQGPQGVRGIQGEKGEAAEINFDLRSRFKVENNVFYFSYDSGNDDLDGKTFATAKKSVHKFIEKLNQAELYSDGDITTLSLRLITHDGGGIVLNGIQGLSLLIASNTGHAPVSELKVINCSNAITLTRLDPSSEVRILNCRNVTCKSLYSTTTKGSGFYIAEGSKVYLEGCKISGAEDGIYVSEFSDVMSLNFIGKGTDTGVTSANGSQVRVSGATIRGDKSNTVEISGGTVTYI